MVVLQIPRVPINCYTIYWSILTLDLTESFIAMRSKKISAIYACNHGEARRMYRSIFSVSSFAHFLSVSKCSVALFSFVSASDLRTGKATSAASAVFIICNSCLGSATLAIPYTFHQAGGIYASMAVMIFSGFLLAATLVIYGLEWNP